MLKPILVNLTELVNKIITYIHSPYFENKIYCFVINIIKKIS